MPDHAACAPCLLLAALLVTVAGCAPERRPPAFAPRQQAPLAGVPDGRAVLPQPAWWKRYGDAQLDRLMDLATRDSPDLQEAQARYETAARAVDTQRAQLDPQVRGLLDGAHGYSKTDIHAQPPAASGTPSPLQNLDISPHHSWSNSGIGAALFSWDLDLWGKQKAAVAQAAGEANAALAEQAMAANSLHYNVALAYYEWQSEQARLQLARQAAQDAGEVLELTRLRVHAGLDDPQQSDRADAQLAEERRNLAMQDGQSALDLAQLAAVIGISPRDLGHLQPRPLPGVETDIPPGASLSLLSRRPDIVAARWEIDAAIHGIDHARAAYYPDVSLTGLAAYLSVDPSLGSGTHANLGLGSFGPSLSLPIFSGGRLRAQFETRQAQLDSAVASYNHAVVQAAHDVARQVLTLQQLQAARGEQDRQVDDTVRQSDRADRRRRQGLDDDRTYLGLRLQVDQARDSQLQLADQLLGTQLALIYALGGGYQAADAPALPGAMAQAADR